MVVNTIVFMNHVAVDDYVFDVLMPDLVGHDHSPAAFVVYLQIWTELFRKEERRIEMSLQALSARTGLSKSAVQNGLRILRRRGLIKVMKRKATSIPQYELVRHWLQRRVKKYPPPRR